MASIHIIGAGAVGSYYGALLARAGHRVTMVTRGTHLEEIRRTGRILVRERDGDTWSAPVDAADAPPTDPDAELVVVTVKSHDTANVAEMLRGMVPPNAVVLSLQNGVENVERLAGVLGHGRVLGATAFVGLWRERPGEVVHGAEGLVTIGHPTDPDAPALSAVTALVGGSWTVSRTADLDHALWHKLLWNVGFNPLCAATGASAGTLLARPEHARVVRAAMEEARAVARARGVAISEADVEDMARDRASLRGYLPSTLRDALAGRRLERDALCGFVAREGARLGIPTPVNAALDAVLALQEGERQTKAG